MMVEVVGIDEIVCSLWRHKAVHRRTLRGLRPLGNIKYGAGDAKIGKIIGGDATEGKQIKRKFLKATPAIKNLRDAVQNAIVETERGKVVRWKRHYLKGLDGRHLSVRSPHSALNLLLQSAGALICKKWIVRTEERLIQRGLKHGWDGDFAYMAWVHKLHCAL